MGFVLWNTIYQDVDVFIETFKKLLLTKEYESIRPVLESKFTSSFVSAVVLDTPDGRYTLNCFFVRGLSHQKAHAWIRDNRINSNNRRTIYQMKGSWNIKKFKNGVAIAITSGYYAPNPNAEKEAAPAQSNVISAADELIKYKQLLDMGVITQEEFDSKKQAFLNANGSVVNDTAAETESAASQNTAPQSTVQQNQVQQNQIQQSQMQQNQMQQNQIQQNTAYQNTANQPEKFEKIKYAKKFGLVGLGIDIYRNAKNKENNQNK
jgi:hypothetical protein